MPGRRWPMRRDGVDPRVALVTGGAQGIGRRIAERFLRDGFSVLAADVDAEACRAAEREIASLGYRALRCDVAREGDVKRAVDEAVSWAGGLDVLVANAGIDVE